MKRRTATHVPVIVRVASIAMQENQPPIPLKRTDPAKREIDRRQTRHNGQG